MDTVTNEREDPPIKAKMSLVGLDSNGWYIVGAVSSALKKAGATKEQVEEFRRDAMSGDYNHLLTTAIRWTDDSEEEWDEDHGTTGSWT